VTEFQSAVVTTTIWVEEASGESCPYEIQAGRMMMKRENKPRRNVFGPMEQP
jgi:hypothetical protein